MPQLQGCCAIPAISSGDLQTFETLVRHNLALFESEKFDFLVTACATCTYTIKKIWPMMLKTGSPAFKAAVARLSGKTRDISEFLVSELGVAAAPEKSGAAAGVTYHDPCHLKKSLGIFSEPRTLLNACPDCLLKEMPEADKCCGMGGSFNIQHYDLSAAVGRQKVENVKASGCATVATSCPACMIQLSDFISKSDASVSVKHVIEIYAESLGS